MLARFTINAYLYPREIEIRTQSVFCADTDIITLIYCSRERKYNSVLFGVKTKGSVVVFTQFLFYYVSTHTTPNRIFSTHADAHEARKAS